MVLRTMTCWTIAVRTHGSNPACRHREKMVNPRRAEIFALPTLFMPYPAGQRPTRDPGLDLGLSSLTASRAFIGADAGIPDIIAELFHLPPFLGQRVFIIR
jgi:hypothetical protein